MCDTQSCERTIRERRIRLYKGKHSQYRAAVNNGEQLLKDIYIQLEGLYDCGCGDESEKTTTGQLPFSAATRSRDIIDNHVLQSHRLRTDPKIP